MKHECPITKALASCCGTTEDAIAEDCPCRTFYTAEQVREWILGKLICDRDGVPAQQYAERNRHIKWLSDEVIDENDGIAECVDRKEPK